jgi:hypothetical protein
VQIGTKWLGPASPGTRPSIVFTLAALNVESLQHMERSVCQLFASAIFACRATRATTGFAHDLDSVE